MEGEAICRITKDELHKWNKEIEIWYLSILSAGGYPVLLLYKNREPIISSCLGTLCIKEEGIIVEDDLKNTLSSSALNHEERAAPEFCLIGASLMPGGREDTDII